MHSRVSIVVILTHPLPVHVLVRDWLPPPHVAEQLSYSLHGPTESKSSSVKNSSNLYYVYSQLIPSLKYKVYSTEYIYMVAQQDV